MDILKLRSGALSAGIVPEIGACIASFRGEVGGEAVDFLRPATALLLDGRDPRGAGCFVMVPFASLLHQARFTFGGKEYQLAHNFPGRDVALHGDAWQNPWQVVECSDARLVLTYGQDGEHFPFAYGVSQTIELTEGGLRLSLSLRNTGERVMPAGMGVHPYFVRSPDVRLRFAADGVWERDANGVPTRLAAVPVASNFAIQRPLGPGALSSFFDGWKREVGVAWPEIGAALTMRGEGCLERLLTYFPAGEDYFCVEPVSNVGDGFNLLAQGVRGHGVTVLAPGQSLEGSVVFDPGAG